MKKPDIGILDSSNIQKAWEYLKQTVTKEDVEKKVEEIKEFFPGLKDENYIYGFAVNQVIAKIFGGGEIESLLRIENDLAKFLGYTFPTQLDECEKNNHPCRISPLI